DILAAERSIDDRRGAAGREGAEIEAGTVKRVDETRRIADRKPAIIGDLLGPIGEGRERALIAFDRFGAAEHFAADRMRSKVGLESLADGGGGGRLEEAGIVNQPHADIAALQRDDPTPPAVAHQVIG